MRVLFGPDFRHLVQYQQLLADALGAGGVDVEFLQGYRRLLPMTRGVRAARPDVFHLHFPVHYIRCNGKLDEARKYRFFADVWLAARAARLVYTVHDLYPTSYAQDKAGNAGQHYLLRRAAGLIVHSEEALKQVLEIGGVPAEKCTVIPHGDLSAPMGQPIPRALARAQAGFQEGERICLAPGIVTPNKGLEELIAYWKREKPDAILLIAGHAHDGGYGQRLNMLASGVANVRLRLGFVSDYDLKVLFCAADCVVINYRTIFTSGVASLARSFGTPLLLPERLKTVHLLEPHPSVVRFGEGDFGVKLAETLSLTTDYAAAEEWRNATAWDKVAARTRAVYESVTS